MTTLLITAWLVQWRCDNNYPSPYEVISTN